MNDVWRGICNDWDWLRGVERNPQFRDDVLVELRRLETKTKFFKNYVIENDRSPLVGDPINVHLQRFLKHCVLNYFDIDLIAGEVLPGGPSFLQIISHALYKSAGLRKMWNNHCAAINLRNNLERREKKAAIMYKCLTIAFVLKQAGKIFLESGQNGLADEYLELSRCYQCKATLMLEECRHESISFAMELVNPQNPGLYRPRWTAIGMHEIAYQGKFVHFLNHRACVLTAKRSWRDGRGEQWWDPIIAPRVSYYLHLVAEVAYVLLFTTIMLSMNRFLFSTSFSDDSKDSEPVSFLNDSKRILELRFVLGFWQIMFMVQRLLTDQERNTHTDTYLNVFYFANFSSFLILFSLQHMHKSWHVWIVFRVVFDISLHISYIYSTILLLRYVAADRFLGSVVKLLSKMSRILLSFLVVFILFWITYAVTILSLTGEVVEVVHIPWRMFSNGAFEIFAELNEDVKEGKIDSCTNTTSMSSETAVDCIIRSWLIPISLLVYVLVSTVVLINLITSFLTSAYDELCATSCPQAELQFEFCRRLDEYRKKPFVPPPLTLLPYILRFVVITIPSSLVVKCVGVRSPHRDAEQGDAQPRQAVIGMNGEGRGEAMEMQPLLPTLPLARIDSFDSFCNIFDEANE